MRVTPELLVEALKMPTNTVIRGASWDAATNCAILSVESPAFPDLPREYHAPFVTWSVRCEWNV